MRFPTLMRVAALAALYQPLWALALIVVGLSSINVALTGFCVVGNILRPFGFTPMLGVTGPTPGNLYFMQACPAALATSQHAQG